MKLIRKSLIVGIALSLILQHASSQLPGAGAPAGAPPAGAGGGRGMRGPAPFEYADNEGWTSLFDGKTLNGWAGDSQLWSVKDGSIYIHPTCEHPTGTTYIHWTGGELSDFALKYELRGTEAVNGGMQFRSYMTADANVGVRYPPRAARGPAGGRGQAPAGAAGGPDGGRGPAVAGTPPGGATIGQSPSTPVPLARRAGCPNPGAPPSREQMAPFDMNGPQADFDAGNNFSGMFYEQGGRGIIARPGHVLLAEKGKPVQDLATLADKATLDSWFHKDEFNQFMIVAKGNTTSIFMNGHLMTVLIDNDPAYFRASGMIGPEVESTGEYWVRNIYMKKF
jgi:hypothetical protein